MGAQKNKRFQTKGIKRRMERWENRVLDAWRMVEWKDKWMTCRQFMETCMDRRVDGPTDWPMDKWLHACMDSCLCNDLEGWVDDT